MKNIIYAFLLLSLASCRKEKSKLPAIEKDSLTVTKTDAATTIPTSVQLTKNEVLKNFNTKILETLKTKDYEKFALYIHPEKGIRFSMYAYVRPEKDKHFSREDFLQYISARTKFTWGEKDGSGELLVISLKDYLDTWVFKRDFTQSAFYLNEFKGTGNSLNNLQKTYPGMDFTENYIPGSEKYGGMDWNALRFVFEEFHGKYYLTAVVNDQWTI